MENQIMFNMCISDIQEKLKKYGLSLTKNGNSYSIDKKNKKLVIVVSILMDVADMEEHIECGYRLLHGEDVNGTIMPLTDENIKNMKKTIKGYKKELELYLNELKKYEV